MRHIFVTDSVTQNLATPEYDAKKFRAYSIPIDVQGKSTDKVVHGYELGLRLDQNTCRSTSLKEHDIWQTIDFYNQVIHVGKYNIDLTSVTPATTAKLDLRSIGVRCYKVLAIKYHGISWPSQLNCHQLSREIIFRMNLAWPHALKVVGDEFCLLVDNLMTVKCCLDHNTRIIKAVK